MKKPVLFAFDFDHTVVDKNTDLIARSLVPGEIPSDIQKIAGKNSGWTEYMRKIFELLHTRKINQETIIKNIQEIPAVPGFVDLLKNLHSNNCEIIIISDSNSIFINEWLINKGLEKIIEKVFTNPAWFDEDGLLNINPYQEQDWCTFMDSKNLCKGHVLKNYIEERRSAGICFDKIAYAGDGKNDYCPMMKLSKGDMAFPRLGYYIIKILDKSEATPVAHIFPWNDGHDIWQVVEKQHNF